MESPEVLEAVLLWLGKDAAAGARKYEEVRQKLIYIFRCRGCREAEELADETIDRTARNIAKPGFNYVGDPIAYFRGVAQNVHLEWLRRDQRFRQEPFSDDLLPGRAAERDDDTEVLAHCLERCLDLLPGQKRELLLRYYRDVRRAKIDNRVQLAQEQGIGLNALRIQVFRLRSQVRQCVESCTTSGEMEVANRHLNL